MAYSDLHSVFVWMVRVFSATLFQTMGGNSMRKKCAGLEAFVTLVLLASMSVTYVARAGANTNTAGVIPPHAKFRGLTYGEWAARWWQAAFALPVIDDDHPIISGGAFGGEDGVLFLTGVGGVDTIEITIPAGTAIFFPIVNAECSVFEPDPFHGDDEEELRECANDHVDTALDLFAVIDGVPVQNLNRHRIESPSGIHRGLHPTRRCRLLH
jgi:hypothetical protein